jgi:Tfp pilus assembly protein PilZ
VTDTISNYGYRTPRFRADFRLLMQIDDRHPALLDAQCTDLSEEGLAADTKASLEIGVQVTLILALPGTSTPMRVSAKVIHRQSKGYGFAFVFSSADQRRHMSEYLESRRTSVVRSPELSG